MMRPRTSTIMPNRETMLQAYRQNTATMHFYSAVMQTCSCCRRRRSVGQFREGSTVCAKCRA